MPALRFVAEKIVFEKIAGNKQSPQRKLWAQCFVYGGVLSPGREFVVAFCFRNPILADLIEQRLVTDL
jgi:hypothetical protein